jgi:hypothetical protein
MQHTFIASNFIGQANGSIQENIIEPSGDVSNIDLGIIENSIEVDRLGITWLEKKRVGNVQFTQTGSYTPIQTQVYDSRLSAYHIKPVYFYSNDVSASLNLPSSSSFVFAEVNNDYGVGYNNMKWNGSKLSGPGVNVNTANTVDGGPVVKITRVNPNQIVFANNQITTINESTTGVRKRSI